MMGKRKRPLNKAEKNWIQKIKPYPEKNEDCMSTPGHSVIEPTEQTTPITPKSSSFADVNEFVHGDVEFEHLQDLCLGLAAELEAERKLPEVKYEDSPYRAILETRRMKGGMLVLKHTAANAVCCSRIISQLESADMLEERDWAIWMLWHRMLDWQTQKQIQEMQTQQIKTLQTKVNDLERNDP